MERLQSLLRAYNMEHSEDNSLAPWNKQFCETVFPKYWETTYSILQALDKNSYVIEIGCGLGAVTSILCYQGYKNIYSFEKDNLLASKAKQRLKELFNRDDIVYAAEYPNGNTYNCDILILVNCAYGNPEGSKSEYLKSLRLYYESAGDPRFFILEVIDDSYSIEDNDFPPYIRLNEKEIRELFPGCLIKSWQTYRYPENKKSKTLYLIERQ